MRYAPLEILVIPMQRDGTSYIPTPTQVNWIFAAFSMLALFLNVLYSFWAVSDHEDMRAAQDRLQEQIETLEVRATLLETAGKAKELMNNE